MMASKLQEGVLRKDFQTRPNQNGRLATLLPCAKVYTAFAKLSNTTRQAVSQIYVKSVNPPYVEFCRDLHPERGWYYLR